MGLQFILGRAGAEHGNYCLEDIASRLKENPQGDPIFYIVPDQMAFQQEYQLLKNTDLVGSIRAQVFSFSRLAWYIFQEEGGANKPFISSTGIQMMLRKLAEEYKESLTSFQEAIYKQGFIEHLESMITELKRYRITPVELTSVIQSIADKANPADVALKNKLQDLTLLYEKLDEQLKGHYIDHDDQLNLMVEKIENTNVLSNSSIYIDGFHRFTPQEFYVLEAMMKHAKEVKITVVLDDIDQQASELDLFFQTKRTYDTLVEIATTEGITIEEPVTLSPYRRHSHNEAFRHLEKNLENHPIKRYEDDAPIKIVEAVHPRAEIEGLAQEIIKLVRDEQYRYRDLAILVREPNTYHDLIETIFEDYDIPVFIDEKKTMLNHPLVELIRTGLEVVDSDWRYDAVFRLLKTGFMKPQDEENPLNADAIDTLENYVLEYGIRKKEQWTNGERWPYQRFTGLDLRKQTTEEQEVEEQINAYRNQVVQAMERFDQMIRQAKTIADKSRVIFEWLEDLNVGETLEHLRDHFEENGDVEKAREQEQVWQAVMELFDEMVEMIGEEEISNPLFIQLVDAGFDTLEFSHVPPTIDHVIIGDVERSRISNVKVAFIVGANEGIYPLKPPADGMVTDEERLTLERYGVTLADRADRVLLDDRFYMYLAFTLPEEKLWISYPLSNEEGKSKIAAPIVKRLKEMFPKAEQKWLLDDEDDQDPLRFITNPVKTRAILTAELSKYLRGYPMNDVYWDALHWYIEQNDQPTRQVLQSLFYRNEPKPLQQKTIENIYDQTIQASVSRLETYFQCSYHYFAQYTLQLKERNSYQLEAPDIGQLFHESLRWITEWVHQDGKAFYDLTEEQIYAYVDRAIKKLAPILNHQILFSSNRYRYILNKLKQVVFRATNILAYQAKHSHFSPAGIEVGFGRRHQLPPLQLPLINGYLLELSGRIDRVDRAEIDNQLFLRIIDYKSSKRDLNLVDVYYGLALQMLTYLDVVLTHSSKWLGKQAEPAGVLYFHVHNPTLTELKKFDEQTIEDELIRSFKMNGLLLEDETVAQAMDTSLDTGNSKIVPFGIKKDGTFSKNGTKTVNEEIFNRMKDYVRTLMVQAGNEIVTGQVKLNPYENKEMTACKYCPFKSVCQFDPILEENKFRRLKESSQDRVLDKMLTGKGGCK
ncbi:helicase-exonuclease AddAB subunit AddB [Bacillaceae bacterium W0354]